jgi:hypothetical protein
MAFDPDKYLAESAPSQEEPKGFDPDAYLAQSRDVASQEPDKMSELHPEWNPTARAALVGAGQGATMGFAEELTAPVVAAGGMIKSAFDQSLPTLPGEDTLSKFQRLMQEYRDVAREEQQAAQEEHPEAYTAGAVGGGLATMPFLPSTAGIVKGTGAATGLGKVAVGAGEGAALGAAYGAGETEGGLEERAAGALEAAKTGALIGGIIPAGVQASKYIGKAGQAVGKIPIVADAVKNVSRGAKGENLITASGRREAAGIVESKSGQLYDDVKQLQKDVGQKISDKIDEASAAGEKVNLTDEVNSVFEKLKVIKAEGSKEASSYAASVESEINKILGIKKPQIADDLTKMDMPEGLNPQALNPNPKIAEVAEILVDPKKAQDLKQVLQEFSPKRGVTKPQEIEAAGAAKELKFATSDKLNEATGLNVPQLKPLAEGIAGPLEQTASLNQQYGLLKDTLKRLGVNERRLPAQIKEKINRTISQLEKENLTGDQARSMMEEILSNLNQVSPEVAAKYAGPLNDAVERLTLASRNLGGAQVKGLGGNIRGAVTTLANVAGLGASKISNIPGVKPLASGISKTSNFAKNVLEGSQLSKPIIAGAIPDSLPAIKAAAEPYKLQRQVAQASENAEPEMLNQEAQNIRSKYGKSGEQLATILENMASKDKNARRALMYTLLQNPAHRKMLGLIKEEE